LAGIVEYSNLNPHSLPAGESLVYIPQYVSAQHHYYQMSAAQLLDSYSLYLKTINSAFDTSWVRTCHAFRTRFAQPVCQVGFAKHIPAVQTPINGLYILDSYQLHPQDRTVSDATIQGQKAAALVLGRRVTR
jgi:protoporphyrinogen oxidase